MAQYRYSLNLQLFSGEKTERATSKKRSDARKKGQVAKSQELPGAFILLFSFLSFFMYGSYMKERIYKLFFWMLNDLLNTQLTLNNVAALFNKLMIEVLLILTPIFSIAVVTAILGNYFQIGFLITGESLIPHFSKLNPLEGAKKFFSLRSSVQLLKTLLKLTAIGYIVYLSLWGEKDKLLNMATLPLDALFKYVSGLTISLGLKIALGLVVLSIFDYMYQKYEYEKGLRMSKQDIKDEYKMSEGDPLVKGKIKEKQRRMAIQRMMQNVPKADVVITNPTHYAVAIKYEAGKMEAPKVLAKGTDFVALKIREIAKENGIVTMENRPLARALYDQVEIDESIPAELFQAVAEVLAYVYKLKGKAK